MFALSAIVLASGFSRRMGGKNKLLLPFRGQPLFMVTVQALRANQPHELFVVSAHEAVLEIARREGAHAVFNDAPQQGISRSIALGCEKATGTHLLFATGDQPHLDAQTVAGLIAQAMEHPKCIICPVHGGRRGSPTIFPAAYREELMQLRGDGGGKAVMRAHPDAVWEVEVAARALDDIDTPEEYEKLERE